MVLLMTVEPGFGGQKFLDLCLPKIRRARELVDRHGLETWLQVDGGDLARDHRALRRGRRRRLRRRLRRLLRRRPRRDGRVAPHRRRGRWLPRVTTEHADRGPIGTSGAVAGLSSTSRQCSRALGSVKVRAGGESPRPGHRQWPVDQVKILDRRSKSGWEAHAGDARPTTARCRAVRATRPPPSPPGSVSRTRTGGEMTFTDAERAAMRRALELAATPGVPLGPNPRVGCVLLDDRTAARSPRASTAAPAARTPRPTRSPRPATPPAARPPSSPSSPATTPAAPARAPRRWSRPAYAAWSSRRPTPTRSPRAAARPCAPPASRSRPVCWPTRHAASTGSGPSPSSTRRPFVTWKFATTLDGRSAAADGTVALGLLAGRAPSTPTGCARSATRCSSAPAPSRSTTRS